MKILVADDEKGFTDFLSEFLIRKGHSVDIAGDGETVLELSAKNAYDVAFLDMTMPGLTGLELADRIRAQRKQTKLFLVTAYPGAEKELVEGTGLDGLIQKPFELAQIEALLNTLN